MSVLIDLLDFLSIALNSVGILILAALGLAIIFGMMGIINFAHGEFIMVGAYATVLSVHAGIPFPVAIVVGGIATGVLGAVLERLVIQHLYDRVIDSMVATWGIGLILAQVVLIIFGPTIPGLETPLGTIQYGEFSTSAYRFVLFLASILLLLLTFVILQYTEFGLHARATIQDNEMANALGVRTTRMYFSTFVFGSILAGLAGGLFAPITPIAPLLGRSYIIEAFVTVIVGGSSVLIGTTSSAFSLGAINAGASIFGGPLAGRVALLLVAIVILRILPEGLSSYFVR